MPATIIGNKQWMEENRSFVENLLAAAFEGGELVRSDDAALSKSSEIAAVVFKEESGAYWKKYFKGVTEVDKTGVAIQLGGSTTSGLGDNMFLFGVGGNDNLYKRVYTVFGNITTKFYPDVMPKVIAYEQVVNSSYIESLSKLAGNVTVDKPTYTAGAPTTGTFAKRSVEIAFETGKTSFTPAAVAQLNDLVDQISVSGLTVQLNGHTDNIGNPTSNLELSKKRAEAVKTWVVTNAGSSFPTERVKTRGYGDTAPVDTNATAGGRAKNRRVEVILLTN
jgi:outer membrane protein OmpA-like peptidoglycan-associated protein